MSDGYFTISTRIYLTPEQRNKLEGVLRIAEKDLDVALTELVLAYLDTQPEPPAEPQPDPTEEVQKELALRKRELRRLRVKLNDPYNPPPNWLKAMATDLEAEIARLERKAR